MWGLRLKVLPSIEGVPVVRRGRPPALMKFVPILRRSAGLLALLIAGAGTAAEPAADDLASLLAEPVYGNSRSAGAAKYAQDLADAPTAVYVRTAGEIRAQGYRTLADVLESLPGVHLRYDRVYTHVGVRGINPPGDYSSRLLVLIDGVRVNEAIYDSATLGREFPLDPGLIDRVEFMPGPGSALYGSNAVLGVVNVITRGPSQLPGWNTTFEAGSAARRKLALTWGGEQGPVRVLFGAMVERSRGRDLYFPEFDTPATNRGWAVGQDGERNDKLFVKARWSDFTWTAELSDRSKSDPTSSYGTVFNTTNYQADRYALSDVAYSRGFGEHHELFARLGVARYAYRSYGIYDQSGVQVPARSDSDAAWTAGELRYIWSGWALHRVLVGIEFQDNHRQAMRSQDLDPAPFVYADLRQHSTRYSLFVNDEWQVAPSVRLNVGLRSDRRFDDSTTTSPRLAALWTPTPQWSFKLQRGTAFREPNVSETRYADGTQVPNDALKAETLASTELAALWRPRPAFELSLSLYALEINDLITLETLPDGFEQYQNLRRARSRGLQLEGTWEPGGGVQWRGSWSRQSATDAATGAPLSDAPRSLLKLSVTAPGPAEGTRLGANLSRVGERVSLAGAALPAHVRINLQLNHAPPGQRWNVGLGIYNLTNRRYVDPAGPEHLPDTLVQDGREFQLRLGWMF